MKRALAIFLLLVLTAVSRSVFAADACVVLSSDIAPYQEGLAGFKEVFHGDVSKFILEGDVSKSSELASVLKIHKCSVVVAFGSTALNFLKLRITEKPLIYAMVLNPASIIGSQKSVTGIHLEVSPEASLSAIRRILPAANRVGVLYNPVFNAETIDNARKVALQLKMELVAVTSQSIADAVNSVSLLADRSDVIWMLPDAITASQKVFEAMLSASLRRGVPLFALSKKHVSEGALAALYTDYRDNGRQAGRMAERVTLGTSTSAIKDEHASKAGIVLNMGTAKKLGLEIPKNVVSEAIEVYK